MLLCVVLTEVLYHKLQTLEEVLVVPVAVEAVDCLVDQEIQVHKQVQLI